MGLGNPGPKYRATRHNVGFLVAESLIQRYPPESSRNKFHADVFESVRGDLGQRWLVVKPLTYMNESGRTVAALVDYYQLPLPDLLVVCDDINLPVGRIRFRRDGSHGGQKGLRDIIERLGTNQFARLRLGVGEPAGGRDVIDHVLGSFTPDERDIVTQAVATAADGIERWAAEGIEAAMNAFNGAG